MLPIFFLNPEITITHTMLTLPKILDQINYTNKKLDYKWAEKDANRFLSQQIINEKLLDQMCRLNYKAAFGFASAAAEWIYWRFLNWRPENSGKTLEIAFKSTQSHWLGQIDKYYVLQWENSTSYDDVLKDKIERAYWVTQDLISDARFNYADNSPTLYGNATRLLTLARYLSTEKELFDNWLKNCFERAQELFPNKQWPIGEELRRGNMDENYDSSHDPFIPREFYFTEGFYYEGADLDKMQQELLSKADYKKNDFLNSPEDMKDKGFQGTPYKYEPR